MLGQPIADVTERIGVTRQIDTVAQRCGRFCACRDDRQVKNGERKHGFKLVRDARQTKGLIAQIRRASAATARTTSSVPWWARLRQSHIKRSAHITFSELI